MAVKALKPKVSKANVRSKYDPHRIKTVADAEAFMVMIENDPEASPFSKEMVAFARERDKSGEPYLTIEEILAELGRG